MGTSCALLVSVFFTVIGDAACCPYLAITRLMLNSTSRYLHALLKIDYFYLEQIVGVSKLKRRLHRLV